MVDVTQHVVVKWNGPSKGSKCSHDQWDRYTCRQLQNRRHHSPFTVTCTHMHQCSHMEPRGRTWEASTPSTYPSGRCSLQYLSLCTCRISKFKKKIETKLVIKKINKMNTNCVKFLIIVIRQFWNAMNLKPLRLSLDGYTEMSCKYHPSRMQRNKSTEKEYLLIFCG